MSRAICAPTPFNDSLTRALLLASASRSVASSLIRPLHAKLVLAIGPLERGDLAMHHGFELARPADGAGDGVVHRRDLAPDGLPNRGDRLLGEPVGLGQPDRDLGHGRGHEAKLLRAPDEQRQEPEDDDRHENGDARR